MKTVVSLLVWLLIGARFVFSNAAAESSPHLQVTHSPETPRSGQKVTVLVRLPRGSESAVLEYQVVLPGKYVALRDPAFSHGWKPLPMRPVTNESGAATFSVDIPDSAQTHRALVRYRIKARAPDGHDFTLPLPSDTQPNYAYFVYDGVPAWKAAIDPSNRDSRKRAVVEFPPEVMDQVQNYFLIARIKDVENATWYQQSFGKDYPYSGTFVADGKVYDHVPFRARGGVWRYSMGKNMWKFNFNRGHHLEAKDDYGRRYRSKWGKLNLRACIQQGDYGRRGEQGMYEAVGFRLFNLVGADAPRTHWVSLRIVGEKEENPSDQYRGDFWGLYLAIENEDEDFLDEHRLPDGNIYKMMFGRGELSNRGKDQPTNGSDLKRFLAGLNRGTQTEAWWRGNVDLPLYYSYRSIVEAIHHYDISDGKNYDFYFNPRSAKWCVIPWDIDLTWGDHMYGQGWDPFYRGVIGQPELKLEYQNRLREVRDLLYNPAETGRLIDECAAIISREGALSIVDADRMKWDYHPIMSSRYVMGGKSGPGLFYQAAPSRTFAGMVEQMKQYVDHRAHYIDQRLLAGAPIPPTPKIAYTGSPGYPTEQLRFQATLDETFSPEATEWRAAQIDTPGLRAGKPKEPGHYEITPAWESGVSPKFQKEVVLPKDALRPGFTYRVRCRIKDSRGSWSHWSDPVEFQVLARESRP